jgi:AcrR family transcriptional regulator
MCIGGDSIAANTRERIEVQALLLFSRQGFHETSVSEIAEKAKVNEGTIFRLYNNKKDLYLEVVRKFASTEDVDLMDLQLSLSMEDMKQDLKLIVQEYFKIYFKKIHALRIFVSGIIQFEELREFGYLVIPMLEKHFKEYLKEMEARRIIKVKDIEIVSDFFMSSVMSDVANLTTFRKLEEYNAETAELISDMWEKRIDFFCSEFVEYLDKSLS